MFIMGLEQGTNQTGYDRICIFNLMYCHMMGESKRMVYRKSIVNIVLLFL